MADSTAAPKLRGHNYKALKEAHVSGHSGGTITDINLVTLVAPSAIFLWSVLQSRYRLFTPYTPAACLTEFLLNCGAILSAITIYASQPLLLNALLIIPAVLILVSTPAMPRPALKLRPQKKAQETDAKSKSGSSTPAAAAPASQTPLPIKPFVTMYRGGMMIITCAAILAVDFKLFPRRFAKVENWGTSLMDMGVGSFVFAAGLAAARGLLKERLPSSSTGGNKGSSSSSSSTGVLPRLVKSLRHAFPLLVLGVLRLLSVKGVDYAEHASEYGVHWNFFFTLAALPPFVAVFDGLAARAAGLPYEVLALAVAGAYEVVLATTGLKAFIIAGPRGTLLEKNREGVFSFFGYLAIFLAGQGAGLYVLRAEAKSPPAKGVVGQGNKIATFFRTTTAGKLTLWTGLWLALLSLTTAYNGLNLRVSRRLANLPYVLWVCAFNCGQLLLLKGIESLVFPDVYAARDAEGEARRAREATSGVMRAFNRNGLALFLLANLLTGAVNLGLPTLHMGMLETMAVLGTYLGVLTGVAIALDRWNLSIKL